VLGAAWATWHLPLLWTDGATLEGVSFWVLLLELPARSVVFTWIFRVTAGSALLAILLHVAMSMCTVTAAQAFDGEGRVTVVILALEWLLAAILTVPRSFPAARTDPRRRGYASRASTPSSRATT